MPFPKPLKILMAVIAVSLANPVSAGELTVFAAASLKTALDEVIQDFELETGHDVVASYAGSSALARQIGMGAPADLFISANTDWMDHLQETGVIEAGSRRDLLGNTLVLIAHGESERVDLKSDTDLIGLLNGGKLAMALVDAVPAGIYGKAALQSLDQWDALAPLVAQTDNVRAALALVATGEAPLGIVYGSDARAETRVSVVGVFPPDSHPPILYPAALVRPEETGPATDFMSYLQDAAAGATFARHGFQVLGD